MREKIQNKNHETYFTMIYSKVIRVISPKGLRGSIPPESQWSSNRMVEATEGCNINQGKCANRVKSTKFVEQIFSTYTRILVILGFAK
jgi:hypothetical protein